MSDQQFLTEPLDEEEERAVVGLDPSTLRSYTYSPMGTSGNIVAHEAPDLFTTDPLHFNIVTGGDSDSPEEATLKCSNWTDRAGIPTRADSSDCDTSTSDEDSEEREYETSSRVADYQTLTPSRQLDNSARCDNDFKWMPSGEMMDDAGDPNFMDSRVEDFSSNASLDRRRRPAGDRSDRDRKTRSSLSTKPPQHPTSVRASPRSRHLSRNEETPPDLERRWNSYEHFRWPEGGWWPPPVCWCHGPPAPPPCCMHERQWPSHPSLPVPSRTYKVHTSV